MKGLFKSVVLIHWQRWD